MLNQLLYHLFYLTRAFSISNAIFSTKNGKIYMILNLKERYTLIDVELIYFTEDESANKILSRTPNVF